MVLFAVSDAVWNAIIAAAVTLILAKMADRAKRAAETSAKMTQDQVAESGKATVAKVSEAKGAAILAAQKAAENVEGVKTVLAHQSAAVTKKIDGLVEVSDKIHVAVNSRLGLALQTIVNFARERATRTGDPNDDAVAKSAERDSDEHARQQFVIDSQLPPETK